MKFKIFNHSFKPGDAVLNSADAEIAVGAEQRANLSGYRIVIDAQAHLVCSHAFRYGAFAYCASTALRFMHSIVSAYRKTFSVQEFAISIIISSSFCSLFRVLLASICFVVRTREVFSHGRASGLFATSQTYAFAHSLSRLIAVPKRKLVGWFLDLATSTNVHSESYAHYAIAYQGVFT
jgi:hypothetical protein